MRSFMALMAAASFCACIPAARAASGFSLDFDGSGNTLAATGFEAAYNLNPAGFSVGGGVLTTATLDGDTFGDYENDPDTAQNMFYSAIDVGAQTVATARLTVSGLGQNFHGGGIWMGTDQDHYVRLGVFHNSFVGGGPIAVELLRENEDRWGGAVPAGPGDDIVSAATAIGAVGTQPLSVVLRLTRNGNDVVGEYSLDDGATYLPAGNFGGLALPGDPQGNGSNTIEGGFKAGIYTAGGGAGSFAFDSLTVVPEPASLAALGLAGWMLRRRR